MEISFPGNKRVDAACRDFVIKTDQPRPAGGDDSAPTPFELFLASLGTCAGIYVLGFFRQRGLSTEGLRITLDTEGAADGKMVSKVRIAVSLPPGFPEKYRASVVAAAELCLVARHLKQPPAIEVTAA